MKTIIELIELYESELDDILRFHKTKVINEITNVKDRTEANLIRSFLVHLKNLPNEPRTVSNNEDKKKVCTHNCEHISQGVHKPVYCGDCGEEL